MKKVLLFLPLISFVLCSCGRPESGRTATVLAEIHKTDLAAQAPGGPTNPPPPPQTAVPRPTDTPPPTASPSPPFSFDGAKMSLQDEDLPEGFIAISPAFVDLSDDEIQSWYTETDLTVENTFLYYNDDRYQYLLGWVLALPDRLTREGFDVLIGMHEYVLREAVQAFGGKEILSAETFTLDDEIGTDSVSYRLIVSVEGEDYPMDVEVIIF